MAIRSKLLIFVLVSFVTLISTVGYSNAQMGAAIAVVGGSVALNEAGKEFRESIDHARAAASSLLAEADDIAKARLSQIDEIANRTISDMVGKSEEAVVRILEDASQKVNNLEKQIMADVKKVIWEGECAGRRLLLGDLGTALGGLGQLIGTNQIRITPPVRVLKTPKWYSGCLWWCRDPYVVEVVDPFGEVYKEIRDKLEASIAPNLVTDDTPADDLVGTYEYLSSFAKKTSCFYTGSEERYNRAFIYYQDKARQWNNIVDVPL